MNYINRQIEAQLKHAATQFAIIAMTGPRQAGKSTLLKFLFPEYGYFTFDDPVLRKQAKEDPGLFMESVPVHSVLDAIQYAPELLPYLKIRVDQGHGKKGQYILAGSQIFHLMAGLTETLAGRVALFELLPFSFHELGFENPATLAELFEYLHKGFYPDPCVHGATPKLYYSSYVQTYLERDIRQITSVQELTLFQRFVELLAARVAGILNVSEVARDCGISHTTAQHWLSLLESSRVVYLLRPYFKNISKRVIKSPKLYFSDSGLLAYLLKYPDSATLLSGPLAANIFENTLITELLKEKLHGNGIFELYYYRDANNNEIDLLIEKATRLHLVEIKMRKNIDKADARIVENFTVPDKQLSRWLVSCFEHELMIAPATRNLPWWKIRSVL
jgi:hypothetical protein